MVRGAAHLICLDGYSRSLGSGRADLSERGNFMLQVLISWVTDSLATASVILDLQGWAVRTNFHWSVVDGKPQLLLKYDAK